MSKEYLHRVTVSPLYLCHFSIDMLRIDELSPATTDDARRIERSFEKVTTSCRVELTRTAPRDWIPSENKWRHAGWHVREHEIEEK